jgi:hypothetical protein
MTWKVEAQVEGGKVATGTVDCESSNRNYILRRFLSRYLKNPGRLEFWFGRNRQRAVITRVLGPPTQLDLDLPDPGEF